MILEISNSKLKTFRDCRQAYYYRYIEKIERKTKAHQLYFGSLVHECLEAHAKGQDYLQIYRRYKKHFDSMFIEEQELYMDMLSVPEIMQNYIEHWQKNDNLEYLLIEHEIEPVEIMEDVVLKGKIDGLVKDERGELWIIEHKTHKNFPNDKSRMMNMQSVIYVHALRKQGYEVAGVLWDYIRSKAPTKPHQLKSGELTKSKSIDTTWKKYKQTVLELGFNPKDYYEMRDILKGKESSFYQRIRQPINQSALKLILRDVKRDAIRMINEGNKPTRNLGWGCDRCSYFSICSAELNGVDTDYIRRNDYQERRKEEKR